MTKKDREGLITRSGRWFERRLLGHVGREIFKGSLADGSRHALEAVLPSEFDTKDIRAGYKGRYKDGGSARFEEMRRARRLSDADLQNIEGGLRRGALLFSLLALVFLIVAFFFMALATDALSFLSGLALLAASFPCGSIALRCSFSAWQVKERRMGAFRDYLDKRLGGRR